jgi:hypothetical protein
VAAEFPAEPLQAKVADQVTGSRGEPELLESPVQQVTCRQPTGFAIVVRHAGSGRMAAMLVDRYHRNVQLNHRLEFVLVVHVGDDPVGAPLDGVGCIGCISSKPEGPWLARAGIVTDPTDRLCAVDQRRRHQNGYLRQFTHGISPVMLLVEREMPPKKYTIHWPQRPILSTRGVYHVHVRLRYRPTNSHFASDPSASANPRNG